MYLMKIVGSQEEIYLALAAKQSLQSPQRSTLHFLKVVDLQHHSMSLGCKYGELGFARLIGRR
jgi:hypothetical protein